MDYKLFQPGTPLSDGTLVILEQLPGLIVTGDVSGILNLGYFPSFNRAYFPAIFTLSGGAQMVRRTAQGGSLVGGGGPCTFVAAL